MAGLDEFAEYMKNSLATMGEFRPSAYYDPDSDLLMCHFSGSSYYGEWLDQHVTVYRDQETKEVVGFEINNARAFVERYLASRR